MVSGVILWLFIFFRPYYKSSLWHFTNWLKNVSQIGLNNQLILDEFNAGNINIYWVKSNRLDLFIIDNELWIN